MITNPESVPGNFRKCRVLGPTADLLNQSVFYQGPRLLRWLLKRGKPGAVERECPVRGRGSVRCSIRGLPNVSPWLWDSRAQGRGEPRRQGGSMTSLRCRTVCFPPWNDYWRVSRGIPFVFQEGILGVRGWPGGGELGQRDPILGLLISALMLFWGWISLCCGAALCLVGCLAVYLAPSHSDASSPKMSPDIAKCPRGRGGEDQAAADWEPLL